MMKKPTFEQWKFFIKSVELGSFAKSALFFNTDPAYVAKSINFIEKYIGHPLFYRTRPNLKLTWAGEQYLAPVKAALANVDSIFEPQNCCNNPNNIYRVGVSTSITPLFLKWITIFQNQFPDIRVEISPINSSNLIDVDSFDLLIAPYLSITGHMFAEPLGKIASIVVSSLEIEDYSLEHPEQLKTLPVISAQKQITFTSKQTKITISLQSKLRAPDPLSALNCILFNPCYAVAVPLWAASPLIQAKKIRRVLPEWGCDSDAFWLIRKKEAYRDNIHKELTKYIQKEWNLVVQSINTLSIK